MLLTHSNSSQIQVYETFLDGMAKYLDIAYNPYENYLHFSVNLSVNFECFERSNNDIVVISACKDRN